MNYELKKSFLDDFLAVHNVNTLLAHVLHAHAVQVVDGVVSLLCVHLVDAGNHGILHVNHVELLGTCCRN